MLGLLSHTLGNLDLAIFQQFAQRQRVFPLVSVQPDELLGHHALLEEFDGLCSGSRPQG